MAAGGQGFSADTGALVTKGCARGREKGKDTATGGWNKDSIRIIGRTGEALKVEIAQPGDLANTSRLR